MPSAHIDAIDSRILEAIQDNGRLSNVDLANRVGLSASACLRRVQALEADGFIRGYAALLSPKRLGLGVTAIVMVQVAQDNEEQMEALRARIAAMPEILSCMAVTGSADYILKVVAPDLEAFERIVVRELLKSPGVKDVRSHFVIGTVKDTAALPLTYIDASHR